MIDTCTPEELANPAMLAANLQMAYMAGDYYRESEYDDQYSAEAYWTTKGKFKGKGATFFGTYKHYTLYFVSWDMKFFLKGPALPKTNQNAVEKNALLSLNVTMAFFRCKHAVSFREGGKPHFFPKNLQKNHTISLDYSKFRPLLKGDFFLRTFPFLRTPTFKEALVAANKRFERQAWSLVLPGFKNGGFDHGDSVVGDGANRKNIGKTDGILYIYLYTFS